MKDTTEQEMIYFFRTADDLIYVGWSQAPSRRFRTHGNDGKILVAARPGTEGNEDAIHAFFSKDKVRPSQYSGRRIFDYVAWLISRGYAATTHKDAKRLPLIHFDIWRPEKGSDPFADRFGQCHLFDHQATGTERIKLSSELVHLSSESDEWYTPAKIIDYARTALGGNITTDPSSCFQANRTVKAMIYYDKVINGLNPAHPWSGTVWLNPPYGRGDSSAASFIKRLVAELNSGAVSAAITCLNVNSTGAIWFRDVWDMATVHLIWGGRINFVGPTDVETKSSPSKGTILSYFGDDPKTFCDIFKEYGELLIRYKDAAE